MKNESVKAIVVTGVSFVAGTFLLALCYNCFLLPNNYVVSGMSGLALVFDELLGINPILFIYASSIALLIISFIFLGAKKTKNTIIGSLLYPLMVTFTSPIAIFINDKFPLDDKYLIIVFAAILYGISNGLIYKGGYTTGGNDVLMQIINKYVGAEKLSDILIVIEIVIIYCIMIVDIRRKMGCYSKKVMGIYITMYLKIYHIY